MKYDVYVTFRNQDSLSFTKADMVTCINGVLEIVFDDKDNISNYLYPLDTIGSVKLVRKYENER